MTADTTTPRSGDLGTVNSTTRSIGIFGGTFDPPHLGHLIVAEHVRVEVDLDEVRLVVANDPWQKGGLRSITKAEDRFRLVQSALLGTRACDLGREKQRRCEEQSGEQQTDRQQRRPLGGELVASRREIDLGGPSYTVETLESFRDEEPEVSWSLIVGEDAAAGLDTWHRADELRAQVEVIVVNRPDPSGADSRQSVPQGWKSQSVSIPAIDISSTAIRKRVSDGSSIRFLTPDPVITLIEQLGIYRQGS